MEREKNISYISLFRWPNVILSLRFLFLSADETVMKCHRKYYVTLCVIYFSAVGVSCSKYMTATTKKKTYIIGFLYNRKKNIKKFHRQKRKEKKNTRK